MMLPRNAVALGGWVLLGAIAWILTPDTEFLNWGFCGSLAIVLLAEPLGNRVGHALTLGLAFAVIWLLGHQGLAEAGLRRPELPLALFGLGALADIAMRPPRHPFTALGAFGIPGFILLSAMALTSMGLAHVATQDAVLLEADRALGVLPSYAAARAFAASPLLTGVATGLYKSLPLEVALVFVASIRGASPVLRPTRVLANCAAAGLFGAIGYWICPAVGPRYAFPDFPAMSPPVLPLVAISVSPEFPRNAMPSLHLTWAWLLWRGTRTVRWLGWATSAWLVGIAAASLGLGEHYLVDLVVAVPFAATIEASLSGAKRQAWIGGGITVAWLIYFRAGGGLSPPLAWTVIVGTLAIGYWVGVPPVPRDAAPIGLRSWLGRWATRDRGTN